MKKGLKFWVENNPNSDEVLSIIENIDVLKDNSIIEDLLKLLKVTQNDNIRNSTVIILANWHEEKVVPVILELLDLDSTKNNRGTLLYALSYFEYASFLPTIIKQLCDGNEEVMEMTIQLLEKLPDSMQEHILNESLNIIKECQSQNTQDIRSKYLEYALEIIEDYA
jgi:HEAT repeat protein